MRHKRLSFALGAMLAFAALVVADTAPGAVKIVGVSSANTMLQGIPQQGIELGKPDAPITLVEFADQQCPFCAEWARDELPGVISRYVRPGKIRIEYRGLAFLGSDSTSLLTLAQAAGEQNKLWNVIELENLNQGSENSGYADGAYLDAIAKAVPGLDAKRAFALVSSSAIATRIAQAKALSQQYQINQTPSFLIGKTGDEQNMTVMAYTFGQCLYDSIDAALAGNPVPAKKAAFQIWAIVLIAMAAGAALVGALVVVGRMRERPSAPPPAA